MDSLERTCVVVIRVWREPEGIRARILLDASPDNDVDEVVVASLDEILSTVRSYLTERLGVS
jgi:hypothetical protein